MNKKNTLGATALVAILATAGFAASTYAYQGDPSVEGPNVDTATHEAMTAAFENGDYEPWVANKPNTGKGRMMDVVNNSETFAKFAAIREARLAGDDATADALRAELGLGQGNGAGQGQGMKGSGTRGQGAQDGSGTKGSSRETRGQNMGGNFVDADGNGVCDLME